MQKRYAVQVKWALEQTEAALAPLAAKAMGIAPGQIEAVEITKQSIDARKGGVCFQVALAVSVRRGVKARPDWKPIEEKKAPAFALGTKRMQNSPVVIGAVGVINTFYFLQHIVTGGALRLVQQQYAMHVAAATTRTTHQSSLLSSGFTRRSSSCFTTLVTRLDIRIPSTSELS